MGVLDYSSTAGSNTSVGGIAITGNSNVQNFDNALRQIMADIAAGIAAGSFSGMGYATKSSGYTIVAADRGKIIDCTTTLELELTAAATLGAGFYVIIKANGGDVTIDPNGTENINGASSSLVLLNGQQAVIACTGSAWHSVLVTAPAASATVAGLVELATDAETQTGTDTARAITPANLAARTATETRTGVVELATTAEVITGTDTARAVTPAGVAAKTFVDAMAWLIPAPADGDYRVVVKVPFGGTITEVVTRSTSGTCTLTVKVNTTALGGTANSVSTSEQAQAHASTNTFATDDDIVLTVSSNSSCLKMSVTIKYTRALG